MQLARGYVPRGARTVRRVSPRSHPAVLARLPTILSRVTGTSYRALSPLSPLKRLSTSAQVRLPLLVCPPPPPRLPHSLTGHHVCSPLALSLSLSHSVPSCPRTPTPHLGSPVAPTTASTTRNPASPTSTTPHTCRPPPPPTSRMTPASAPTSCRPPRPFPRSLPPTTR